MSAQFWQDSLKFFCGQHNWLAQASIAMGVIVLGTSLTQATPPYGAQATPDAIYYAQSDFSLPFQVKPGGRCPEQLDLLVSRDGGRSWHVHQSAAPAEGRFRFSQIDEGEYWLKVQVRDAAGSSLSPSTMHLFVDRTCPTSTMQCDWQGDSTLLLTGTVDDARLDPQSLMLQLRTDVDTKPSLVPVKVISTLATAIEWQAVIEMVPCKSFELRLKAMDRAGNRLITGERYFHPTLAGESDALLPASDSELSEDRAADTLRLDDLEIAKTDWTMIQLGSPKPLTRTPSTLVSAGASQSIVRNAQRRAAVQPEELVPPERDTELTIDPPMRATPVTARATVSSASRKFKINYNLAESVPTDQLNVELWVTNDHGNSWEFWGLDRDAQSPAWVAVDRDGEFGFCVVCIHADADLRFRPESGDSPDLVVIVKEPPTTRRLLPASRD